MSFPRYPSYKDSGVEWLGKVPGHWEVRKLSQLFRGGKGKNGQMLTKEFCGANEGDYPVYSGQTEDDGVMGTWDQFEFDFGAAGVLFSTTVGAKAMHLRQLFGRFSLSQNCMIIWTTSERCITRFFYYHFQPLFQWQRSMIPDHMQPSFRMEDLYGYAIALPPSPEQTQIAVFLDRETAKIDELVAEQRRLMELLKEKRQAVISHAVTKGLNPDAPMKPSGIAWLGDVPAHWRVGKLGHASKLRGGFAFSAADFGTEGIVVIRMNNLKRGRLDLSEAARIPESSCNQGAALSEGDLIWGMSGSTGETGSLGNYARVRGEDLPCQLNQRVGRFAADHSILNLDFLEQVIQTPYFYEQVMLLVTGTAQSNVSSEQVQSCLVALPPVSEQIEIAAYVACEACAFNTLTTEAQRAIDLLQERRTALISAAVTGQIDVCQLTEEQTA